MVATAELPLPPAFVDDNFQDISVASYRLVYMSYPGNKSHGFDLLGCLLDGGYSMPDHVLFFFVLFLRFCQWHGLWPDCFSLTMAMMPKRDDDTRCVAKTSVVYRMWYVMCRPVDKGVRWLQLRIGVPASRAALRLMLP